MPNRFVQAIRSGSIDSVEDLKAAFRALALETHPDLGARASERGGSGGEDPGEAFIRVRAEYEAALANFERHRFGASRRAGGPEDPGLGGEARRAGASVGAEELWACLALLLKRGFPKEARHEKEILRYEYARWRFRGALAALDRRRGEGPGRPAAASGRGGEATLLFEGLETELLGLRRAAPASLKAALDFLRELADYARSGHPAERVALVRELDALRLAPGLGTASRAFLALLAAELGIGPTLAP